MIENRASAYDYAAANGLPVVLSTTGVCYRRRPARLHNASLAPASLRAPFDQLRAELGWQGAVRFAGGWVVGDGYLFGPDGTLITDTVPGGPDSPWAANLAAAGRQGEAARKQAAAYVDRPALLLRQLGAGNYGHWLMDALPRLLWFREQYGEPIDVWVHPANLALAHGSLRIVAPDCAIRALPPAARFRELWFAAHCSRHPLVHHPLSVPRLRTAFAACMPDTGARRRLFVARDDAATRRLVNDDSIWSLLRDKGYERISCGSLDIERQVALFSEAESVVGVLGAALTNALFAMNLRRFVALAPATMLGYFYWDLAHHLDVEFHLVLGKTHGGKPDTAADFAVDTQSLGPLLD